MTTERRYVVTPDVALALAADTADIAEGIQLVAPTLIRSQVLSRLYQLVRSGRMDEPSAREALDYIRNLRMRLLGDRVLQDVAWKMAIELDLPDTVDAEYIALTRLQADALVTVDDELRIIAARLVPVAPVDDLIGDRSRPSKGAIDDR